MRSIWWLGIGLGLGFAGTALFDPRSGAERRARLRAQAVSRARSLAEGARAKSRDLRARAAGSVHEIKARLGGGEVSDDVLVERVRAQLGRPVSNPRAIHVTAHDGCVELRGVVLASELPALLVRVRRVRGVRDVIDGLEVRDSHGS
jgi:osmotically-inducible protein OsmY